MPAVDLSACLGIVRFALLASWLGLPHPSSDTELQLFRVSCFVLLLGSGDGGLEDEDGDIPS